MTLNFPDPAGQTPANTFSPTSTPSASPRCVNVVVRTANTLDIVVERSDDAAQDDDGYISVMILS